MILNPRCGKCGSVRRLEVTPDPDRRLTWIRCLDIDCNHLTIHADHDGLACPECAEVGHHIDTCPTLQKLWGV